MHGAPIIEGQVDEGRHTDTPHSCQHGQGRLPRFPKLPHGHLVLELYADKQEKDSHEEVVHEALDRDGRKERAYSQRQRQLEELVKRVIGGGVGNNHGQERRHDHGCGGDRAVGGHALESRATGQTAQDLRLADDVGALWPLG